MSFLKIHYIGIPFVIIIDIMTSQNYTYKQTKMKNSIFIIILMLITNVMFSQNIFDKYDGQDGVGSIVVNKKMFQMMGSVKVDSNDKETQLYLNLIRKLENLRVFTTTNAKYSSDMKLSVEKYLKSAGLEELARVNENGRNVKIMVKSGTINGQVKEILMFIEDNGKQNETVLMSLTGDIDLNDVFILTDKMNIPGSLELKKATRPKK